MGDPYETSEGEEIQPPYCSVLSSIAQPLGYWIASSWWGIPHISLLHNNKRINGLHRGALGLPPTLYCLFHRPYRTFLNCHPEVTSNPSQTPVSPETTHYFVWAVLGTPSAAHQCLFLTLYMSCFFLPTRLPSLLLLLPPSYPLSSCLHLPSPQLSHPTTASSFLPNQTFLSFPPSNQLPPMSQQFTEVASHLQNGGQDITSPFLKMGMFV